MKIKSFILLATLLAAILPQTSHATICTDAMATLANALNELNLALDSGNLKAINQAQAAYFIAVEGASTACEHDWIISY